MHTVDSQPQPAGEWLKHLLLQMMDRAAYDVGDLQRHPKEALHRLRLRMKKADALLYLGKNVIRKSARERLREQFKALKNACGGQRDAEVLAKLARDVGTDSGLHLAQAPAPPCAPDERWLRLLLVRLRRALSEQIFDHLTWDDIEDNYAACYRSGRHRMRKAEASGAADDYHRWRKRVKSLYYQSQALANVVDHARRRLKCTRKLGKLLGKDHDLTVLENETASRSPDNPWEEPISDRREELRPKALRIGGQIFHQPPHRFARLCSV